MKRCGLKTLVWLLPLLWLGMPAQTAAQGGPGMFWLGSDLQAACTSGDDARLRLCAGYVMAIVDVIADARNDGTARACVPFNVNQQQVLDIAVGYLRDNPQLQRRLASGLVMAALNARYPCP